MAARQRPESVSDWVQDEDSITVFTDGDQAAWDKKGSGFRRFVRWYMICSAIFIPIFALLALAVVLGEDETPPSSDYSVGNDAAQAQLFLEKWLATDPQPLDKGRVMTFNGQTVERDVPEDPGGNEQDDQAVTTTTYKFVVADGFGNLWTSSVQTTHTAEDGTRFTGPPSLVLLPPFGTDGENEWPWPGIPQVASSNTAIEDSITLWANALTQEEPSVLKQTIGDPDPARSYQTIPSMTLGEANIRFMGGLWADGEEVNDDEMPDQIVARVTFPIGWDHMKVPEEAELPEVTYDLLITGANSGSPKVVAWNVPGPVSDLEPYMNAIRVGDGDIVPPATPAPTESGSATVPPSTEPTG